MRPKPITSSPQHGASRLCVCRLFLCEATDTHCPHCRRRRRTTHGDDTRFFLVPFERTRVRTCAPAPPLPLPNQHRLHDRLARPKKKTRDHLLTNNTYTSQTHTCGHKHTHETNQNRHSNIEKKNRSRNLIGRPPGAAWLAWMSRCLFLCRSFSIRVHAMTAIVAGASVTCAARTHSSNLRECLSVCGCSDAHREARTCGDDRCGRVFCCGSYLLKNMK